ncbi:MAG TPA: aminopeptidase [Thermoplasmata archaeon]|nr:aminopeptidase [Thermoplasmata archaeon]
MERRELIENLARNALKESLHLKKGQNVIVETYPHGLEFATEFIYQARALGARAILIYEDEATLFRTASTLDASKAMKVGSHEWAALAKTNAYVFFPGPADIGKIREIGVEKWGKVYPDNEEWYKRAKKSGVRGVRILLGYASKERASSYGLDHEAWQEMLLRAGTVPPKSVRKTAGAVAARLKKGKEVRITAPNGTDLKFRLAGRAPQSDTGSVEPQDLKSKDGESNFTTLPAGQVWVAPDEKSAEGSVVFDRPSPYLGRWVRGIEYEFRGGRLAAHSVGENPELFEKPFEKAKGDKDRLGMLILGVSPEVRTGFLQDAMSAGAIQLTLGANGNLGGKNKTGFYFGATLTGGTLTVDGKTVIDAGRLSP